MLLARVCREAVVALSNFFLFRARSVQDSDKASFRRNVRRSRSVIEFGLKQRFLFDRLWEPAVDHFLLLLDVEQAAKVCGLARERGLRKADRIAEEIAVLRGDIAAVASDMAELSDHLRSGRSPEDSISRESGGPMPLLVMIPSIILTRPGKSELGFALRELFSTSIEALRANRIDYRCTYRVWGHGTPLNPRRLHYISLKTEDASRRGIHFETTEKKRCFSIDRKGYSGWSEFSELDIETAASRCPSQAEAEKTFEIARRETIENNTSKYRQPSRRSDANPREPYIFVALQKINDSVQRVAHIPMLTMLEEVVAHARSLGVKVVVKRHPNCDSWRTGRALRVGAKRGLFEISTDSIHDLIEGSLAVCVVNSSVGAEAMLHRKPVYLFGRAAYQAACFRITARGEFARQFKPGAMPVSEELLKRYFWAYRNTYEVDLDGGRFFPDLEKEILKLAHDAGHSQR